MITVLTILAGMAVVFALTVLTGYFVAQEFGYMAVDRARLKAKAATGDAGAERALGITRRTSFMLSGAQLGITVTGLLVGYVAEPLIGAGIGELLGGAGVPTAVGVAMGTVFALLFSTVVQMVFGELFPKNLAIARPEPVARRLAWSTALYLSVFGWLIRLFDHASNLLLKAVRIEPVHDVEHAATARDLEHIVAASRDSGDLPAELSTLLDRTLDLHERTAEHAMIPRPSVTTVRGGAPVSEAIEVMAASHSRLPVLGTDVDDVVGIASLRDLLAHTDRATPVRDVARPAVMVPESLPLPAVLARLRDTDDQFACVVDEYGGLAGVITVEDIAEELVGEIADEHDTEGTHPPVLHDGTWTLPGATHLDEVERLIGHDLPEGDYETLAGLVMSELQRLPDPGDTVEITLPKPAGTARPTITVTVEQITRRVPHTVSITLVEAGR
ncbi:hemolysin family protein [Actinophytocola algeriensis]|uniref:CBS domain containing-hemolysin-like protein n=1 Tax=Actinophytocola algeriensis TaxID=1768010 RepID=A0A7W7Q1F1_9PSEU|nr:hemolysin family protein [Actinophytocola algeriensis]MBB4905237.1 CBS domain containing-hemolysin-like protein [Actinophytocola algeriensis]MBE1473078.1 CBS domain containing-hemolysin-like protein [Actinophytocola algeriensis]